MVALRLDAYKLRPPPPRQISGYAPVIGIYLESQNTVSCLREKLCGILYDIQTTLVMPGKGVCCYYLSYPFAVLHYEISLLYIQMHPSSCAIVSLHLNVTLPFSPPCDFNPHEEL